LAQTLRTYLMQQHETAIAHAAPETGEPLDADDGFGDLRHYVRQVLSFGATATEVDITAATENPFFTELTRYTNAKKRGRGNTAICSLCSSPYTVEKQREAAILFAPQVYSNKLALHGSNAIRDICAICGLEVMLRQLVMNQTAIFSRQKHWRFSVSCTISCVILVLPNCAGSLSMRRMAFPR
jgi:CRISPR-associated protein Csc3